MNFILTTLLLLCLAFTRTGRGECIVFSNDRGRTWTEFAGNPVVKHKGRDPRLLWHAPAQKWIMTVYDEAQGKRCLQIGWGQMATPGKPMSVQAERDNRSLALMAVGGNAQFQALEVCELKSAWQ